MARFSARPSLTELRPRTRSVRRHTKRCPSTFSRYTHSRKAKSMSRAMPSMRSPLSFVYVGNLRSDVRNEDLETLFTPCGKVRKIDVRCCSGTAVPSGAHANTVYATVLFGSVEGATQALAMNGNPLLGKKIVVSPSFLGLPEASRGIRRPIAVCGVNLTNISDTIQHVVNRICTGGTQIFPSEED